MVDTWGIKVKKNADAVDWYSTLLVPKISKNTNIDVIVKKYHHGHSAHFIPEKISSYDVDLGFVDFKIPYKVKPVIDNSCLTVSITRLNELESVIQKVLLPMTGKNTITYDSNVDGSFEANKLW